MELQIRSQTCRSGTSADAQTRQIPRPPTPAPYLSPVLAAPAHSSVTFHAHNSGHVKVALQTRTPALCFARLSSLQGWTYYNLYWTTSFSAFVYEYPSGFPVCSLCFPTCSLCFSSCSLCFSTCCLYFLHVLTVLLHVLTVLLLVLTPQKRAYSSSAHYLCRKNSTLKVLTNSPFTTPACTISRLKVHGHPCKQYIFRSYNTSTFKVMRFDDNPFTCQWGKTAYGLVG